MQKKKNNISKLTCQPRNNLGLFLIAITRGSRFPLLVKTFTTASKILRADWVSGLNEGIDIAYTWKKKMHDIIIF